MLNKDNLTLYMLQSLVTSKLYPNNLNLLKHIERIPERVRNDTISLAFLNTSTFQIKEDNGSLIVDYLNLGKLIVTEEVVTLEPNYERIGELLYLETCKVVRSIKLDGIPLTLSPRTFKGDARILSKMLQLDSIVLTGSYINTYGMVNLLADKSADAGRYTKIQDIGDNMLIYHNLNYKS